MDRIQTERFYADLRNLLIEHDIKAVVGFYFRENDDGLLSLYDSNDTEMRTTVNECIRVLYDAFKKSGLDMDIFRGSAKDSNNS